MYTNATNLPLSIAVFLATDTYDYNEDPDTISATTLMKPLRQLVLAHRIPREDAHVDITNLVNSRMGQAIHAGLEDAWKNNAHTAMKALGYPQRVIDSVVINPETVEPGKIPVYVEQRHSRKLGKWTISGKSDLIIDGGVKDLKTTSTFTAIHGTSDLDYILQGSIYRWLSPDKITHDEIEIQWLFTDWSRQRAMTDKNYPQNRIVPKNFKLKSLTETEAWIKQKLYLVEKYWDAPQDQIPDCSDEELWRTDPVYKYFKNPANQRSTKNFDSLAEARMRQVEDGSVGIIKTVPGRVVACKYCPAFDICTQKDRLMESGDLEIN